MPHTYNETTQHDVNCTVLMLWCQNDMLSLLYFSSLYPIFFKIEMQITKSSQRPQSSSTVRAICTSNSLVISKTVQLLISLPINNRQPIWRVSTDQKAVNCYTNLATIKPEHSVLLCMAFSKPKQLHVSVINNDCSEVLHTFWLCITMTV